MEVQILPQQAPGLSWCISQGSWMILMLPTAGQVSIVSCKFLWLLPSGLSSSDIQTAHLQTCWDVVTSLLRVLGKESFVWLGMVHPSLCGLTSLPVTNKATGGDLSLSPTNWLFISGNAGLLLPRVWWFPSNKAWISICLAERFYEIFLKAPAVLRTQVGALNFPKTRQRTEKHE